MRLGLGLRLGFGLGLGLGFGFGFGFGRVRVLLDVGRCPRPLDEARRSAALPPTIIPHPLPRHIGGPSPLQRA